MEAYWIGMPEEELERLIEEAVEEAEAKKEVPISSWTTTKRQTSSI